MSVPRLSPRLRAKVVWTQGPETCREQPRSRNKSFNTRRGRGPEPWSPGGAGSQEQVYRVGHQTWIPGREGAEPAWMVGQEPGPEQDWVADGGQGQNQVWSADRDPAGGQGSSGSEQVWGSVQSQDQSWSETSRDGEDIWRPGGFLSTQSGQTNNVLLPDLVLCVVLSRPEHEESPERPCGSETSRLHRATRGQTPS